MRYSITTFGEFFMPEGSLSDNTYNHEPTMDVNTGRSVGDRSNSEPIRSRVRKNLGCRVSQVPKGGLCRHEKMFEL